MLALHGEFCLLYPKFNCDNPHNTNQKKKKKINRRKGENESKGEEEQKGEESRGGQN